MDFYRWIPKTATSVSQLPPQTVALFLPAVLWLVLDIPASTVYFLAEIPGVKLFFTWSATIVVRFTPDRDVDVHRIGVFLQRPGCEVFMVLSPVHVDVEIIFVGEPIEVIVIDFAV